MEECHAGMRPRNVLRLREVLRAVAGCPGITISKAAGCGSTVPHTPNSIKEELTDFTEKLRVEIIAPDELADVLTRPSATKRLAVIGKAARERGFPAIASCDRNGLYGAMAFGDACKAAGVQPIVGALLSVARPGQRLANGAPLIDWLALYAQDEVGYGNLCALVSHAHLGRPVELDPHVTLADLAGRTDGLICLTAGGEGALTRLLAGEQMVAANDYIEQLEALFAGRLYLELSRRGDAAEITAEKALIDLAYARALPLVATNPASFVEPQFHPAHDAMLCIAQSAYVETVSYTHLTLPPSDLV